MGHMNTALAVGKGKIRGDWIPALTELIGRESSWNHNAKNPKSTAKGYGQFLAGTRRTYEKKMGIKYDGNPVNQILMTAQYIKDRYGTPQAALAFWDKNHWY